MLPIEIFPAQNLKGKYCLSPFVQVSIDPMGQVGICGCSIWQPTMIGNIFETPLTEMFAGERARNIRQSIIDGTYIYCHPERCGILRERHLNEYDTLPPKIQWAVEDSSRFLTPHHFVLGMDRTCNLSCPSCRTHIVKNDSVAKEKQQELSLLLTKNLFDKPTEAEINLTMDVGGELFASPFLLDFVNNIRSKDFPNLKLDIISNGLLIPERWHRLGEMQNHVTKLTVSYDATEPATYEKIRRGGKWKDLTRALEWIKNKKAENGMRFHARMVIQKDNYNQMRSFYDLSKFYSADIIEFQRMVKWLSHIPTDEFIESDAFDPKSSVYPDALECFKQVENLTDAQFWHGLPKVS